jgi:hypothetical protein
MPPRSPHAHSCQATRGGAGRRRSSRVPSNGWPSRHIAYRIRARRRASATTAIRRPRRWASRSAHVRNGARRGLGRSSVSF